MARPSEGPIHKALDQLHAWMASHGGSDKQSPTPWRAELRSGAGFWLLGLLNNLAYVIMMAGATEIASGAVGLVYFCAIFPTLIVKLTGPYWFHLVPYRRRMIVIALLMSTAYCTVAYGRTLRIQLLGVALIACQGGLGEATVLGLCAFYDSRKALTAWSSGTGFAGVAGYAWVAVLRNWLGLTFFHMLMIANVTSLLWLLVFFVVLAKPRRREVQYVALPQSTDGQGLSRRHGSAPCLQLSTSPSSELRHADVDTDDEEGDAEERKLLEPRPAELHGSSSSSGAAGQMGFGQRLRATARLWPYTVPLMLVYFAEYAMQSGTWTAIGFPVDSKAAREQFYMYGNWCYQAGVFVSRSSGLLFQADRTALWAMPMLQACILLFFLLDAVMHWWYNYGLLVVCFITGLLGGAVYVNAFTLLSKEVPPKLKEFSLAAACVADSLGIACADVVGILIQGCLYRWNNIRGAAYSCTGTYGS